MSHYLVSLWVHVDTVDGKQIVSPTRCALIGFDQGSKRLDEIDKRTVVLAGDITKRGIVASSFSVFVTVQVLVDDRRRKDDNLHAKRLCLGNHRIDILSIVFQLDAPRSIPFGVPIVESVPNIIDTYADQARRGESAQSYRLICARIFQR